MIIGQFFNSQEKSMNNDREINVYNVGDKT